MIQAALAKLVEKEDLTFDEARESVGEIFAGAAPPSLVAAFLVALRMKGETVDEIAGAAEAMRGAGVRVHVPGASVIVDTCGTGGDRSGSFNISTAAAFVVAGAGFPVAKHGNRSISSRCGSADVLEALGVKIDPGAVVVEKCLRHIGLAFFFAPAFHPAMKHAMPVRKDLGVRTVFNLLGPLTNPAGANVQVIGVYSAPMVNIVARVLVRLGTRHGLVVHGGGHDEIVLSGPTLCAEIVDGRIRRRTWTPKDFGFSRQAAGGLVGGDREDNAGLLRRLLSGERGGARDVVVANAAAALWVAGRAAGGRPELKTLKDARRAAEQVLDSGAALKKLEQLAALTSAA